MQKAPLGSIITQQLQNAPLRSTISQHIYGQEAWNLFEQKQNDGEHGYGNETCLCYEKMWVEGVPLDAITLAYVLKACVSNGDTIDVSWIYVEIILKGLERSSLSIVLW